ncbi:MAG: Mth938-like domain-containing protein [Rhodomicrobium sp.]
MSAPFTLLASWGAISAYPGGEFHFDGKRHRGALLVSPGGIRDWRTASVDALDEEGVLGFLDAEEGLRCDFLLLGTGPRLALLPASFVEAVERRGLGLEAMDTGAACRTYNILLAENRQFLAALLPL